MRIARRRPVTQAIAGVFGVGIAAYIAYRTDSAKGYFLLGIWSYLLYGGALLLSMLVRWPLIGVIWEGINGRGTGLAVRHRSWSAATTWPRWSGCWCSPRGTWCRTTCTTPTRWGGWPRSGC